MDQVEVFLIVQLLRQIAPYIKEMAKRTENTTDDLVAEFICRLVGINANEKKE